VTNSPIKTPKKTGNPAEAYVVAHPHMVNQTWTADQINAHADAALKYYQSNYTEPYISTYFAENLIPRSTYSTWGTRSEYFAKVWEQLKELQELRLGKWLLSKDNSTTGLIFALKNVSGWRDTPADADPTDHKLVISKEDFADDV